MKRSLLHFINQLIIKQLTWRRKSFSGAFLVGLLLLVQASPALAQWTRKQDAHKTRSEVTSVVYKGKLFTFIGFSNSALEVEPTSEAYDPATNQWQLLAPMPAGKVVTHQGVAQIDNTVWHIGGRVGKHPGPLTSEVWIYNLDTNQWSSGPQLKDPASGGNLLWGGGGAALLGRTLHVFGGFAINACNNDQDRYHLTLDVDKWLADPANTKWENKLKPLPLKRNHLSVVVLGGKIYALGGQYGHDCGGGSDQRIVHRYDRLTDTWTLLTDFPTPRSHAEGSTFALDGKIYVVAGQGASGGHTNKVTVFTPEANGGLGSWADAPAFQLASSYEGLAAKVINTTFVVSHGGINGSDNPRKETYTAPITRNPVYQLGFAASCLNKSVAAGGKTTAQNLLFSMEGPKAYTTSSSASWLKVSKNTTGTAVTSAVDIEASIDASGLAPGDYSATITASGSGTGPTYTAASFCVNLKVTSSTAQPTVRVNAGGNSETVSGTGWAGCSATTSCSGYVSGGFAYTQSPLPTITGVPANMSQQIFQTEWTGGQTGTNPVPVGATAFRYNIPVANGNYLVRLHFTELNKNGVGLRVFDVNIEGGAKELTNFDIFKESGGMYKAIFREFLATVADGNLTIDFIRQVENAKISAIEVVPVTTTPPPTTSGLITSLSTQSSRAYALASLQEGVAPYTDRSYMITTVPAHLAGADFIQVPNDDKINTSTSLVSFTLHRSATVHVAYDPRSSSLPAWLAGWQNTGAALGVNDPGTSSLDLYSKSFGAGTVTLGGNLASPASGAQTNYLIIAVEGASGSSDQVLYEAEEAAVFGAEVARINPGYSGTGFVDYVNDYNDYLEWTVARSQAGTYRLVFGYANVGPTTRPLRLEVNGAVVQASLDFRLTANWATWAEVAVTVQLQAGTNKIRLSATGQSGGNLDYLRVEPAGDPVTLHEAELAAFFGAEVASNNPGYSGTGFVDYVNDYNDYLEWTVARSQAGSYELLFGYANVGTSGDRPLRLEVNGVVVNAYLSFPSTGGWSTWSTVSAVASLQAGTSKIRLTATGNSGANIDYLQIAPSGSSSTSVQAVSALPNRPIASSVYPNPAGRSFTIDLGAAGTGEVQVEMVDLTGRLVRSFRYTAAAGEARRQEHLTEGLENGVYLLRVSSAGQTSAHRLLITR